MYNTALQVCIFGMASPKTQLKINFSHVKGSIPPMVTIRLYCRTLNYTLCHEIASITYKNRWVKSYQNRHTMWNSEPHHLLTTNVCRTHFGLGLYRCNVIHSTRRMLNISVRCPKSRITQILLMAGAPMKEGQRDMFMTATLLESLKSK